MIPVVVLTSDATSALLPAFAHQFGKYWGEDQRVIVGGFGPLAFPLPDTFSYRSIGAFRDFPVERWSDALIAFLDTLEDELVTWCMDDYWLTRPVDRQAVAEIGELMRERPEIARVDLTCDVEHVGHADDVGSCGRLDLLECRPGAPYRLGLQCGMWRRARLRSYLRPGETPWQTEWAGTERMDEDGAVVLGTRQWPVRYLIARQRGVLRLDGGDQNPRSLLSRADLDELSAIGLVPEG